MALKVDDYIDRCLSPVRFSCTVFWIFWRWSSWRPLISHH